MWLFAIGFDGGFDDKKMGWFCRDAKALQEKLARKAAKDAAGANGGKNGMKTNK